MDKPPKKKFHLAWSDSLFSFRMELSHVSPLSLWWKGVLKKFWVTESALELLSLPSPLLYSAQTEIGTQTVLVCLFVFFLLFFLIFLHKYLHIYILLSRFHYYIFFGPQKPAKKSTPCWSFAMLIILLSVCLSVRLFLYFQLQLSFFFCGFPNFFSEKCLFMVFWASIDSRK